MNIYLAARYERREELNAYATDLARHGHHVISRWIRGEHEFVNTETDIIRYALEDCEDLIAADMVISFTEEPRSGHSRGGRHVEFGLAVAFGKKLCVVGYRENVFHYLPEVAFFQTWKDCLESLTKPRETARAGA
ncbi:MAG: hypothetical protein ABFD54_05820 [Armatimonadota bacterium]|nr:nucleoside 2-deoxyribosyltransferase [bacterium]